MRIVGVQLSRSLFYTYAMVGGLKLIVPRDRPNGESHSFPSGHTAGAFAVVVEGVAEGDVPGEGDDLLGEVVVDAVVHDESRGQRAALAGQGKEVPNAPRISRRLAPMLLSVKHESAVLAALLPNRDP